MEASRPAHDLAATLDDGDVAPGILDDVYSPTLVEFYGELGVDSVRLGLERGRKPSMPISPLQVSGSR